MASKQYPDLSDIFAKRDAGRSARAKASMDEKFKVMDKLRATADEFKDLRAQLRVAARISSDKHDK